MKNNPSIAEGISLGEGFVRNVSAAELMKLAGLSDQEVAEATGFSCAEVHGVANGEASSEVEFAVLSHLLKAVASVIEVAGRVADSIYENRLVSVRSYGDGYARIKVDLPVFDEPIEGVGGSPIPASILNLAAAFLAAGAADIGTSRFVDQMTEQILFAKHGLKPCLELRSRCFEDLPSDAQAAWRGELSKIAW